MKSKNRNLKLVRKSNVSTSQTRDLPRSREMTDEEKLYALQGVLAGIFLLSNSVEIRSRLNGAYKMIYGSSITTGARRKAA
jgi:hypothetical protein